MKKGKTVTFQLQDQHEKELFDYCEQLHNFSGTIKRIIAGSEGFKTWREKQQPKRSAVKVISSQGSGGIKFTL